MDKKIFEVRSVSASHKDAVDKGTTASLYLQRFGFAPEECKGPVCKSVPREGERFLLQVDEHNSSRFLLYRANTSAKPNKWDNIIMGFFTRTNRIQESDGRKVFTGSNDKFEMISFTTDAASLGSAITAIPVVPPVKKTSPGTLPPAVSSPKALERKKLSDEEIVAYAKAFHKDRDPKRQQPYEVVKGVLHLFKGGCDDPKKIAAYLDVSVGTVYQALPLKDLSPEWIEKLRKDVPDSVKLSVEDLLVLAKIADKAEREKRYAGLVAPKAEKPQKAAPKEKVVKEKVVHPNPADSPEVKEYAARFNAERTSEQKPSRKAFQIRTIEAVLWCARRKLRASQIARTLDLCAPTVRTYLPLLQLPEEWLNSLSLTVPEAERLGPQDAIRLAAMGDVPERKILYDTILVQRREKADKKKPPQKQKTVIEYPVSMSAKIAEIRSWIKKAGEIIADVKKKGDNKLEPSVQGPLLEAIRGLIKAFTAIADGRVFQKEDPYPQDVRYFTTIQAAPLLEHASTLADELEGLMVS